MEIQMMNDGRERWWWWWCCRSYLQCIYTPRSQLAVKRFPRVRKTSVDWVVTGKLESTGVMFCYEQRRWWRWCCLDRCKTTYRKLVGDVKSLVPPTWHRSDLTAITTGAAPPHRATGSDQLSCGHRSHGRLVDQPAPLPRPSHLLAPPAARSPRVSCVRQTSFAPTGRVSHSVKTSVVVIVRLLGGPQ